MRKIMTAMSGGVDSSAAALLLHLNGYDTAGMTMKLHSFYDGGEIEDARVAADAIGIEHFVTDMSERFERCVISPFCDAYIGGETPNPCIMCNKHIKFGAFFDEAIRLSFDGIATGHYATVEKDSGSGRFLIKKAVNTEKDQSYVLYALTQDVLSRLLLPLGDKNKSELRELLREYKIPTADRPESQDICFVPDGNYADFIERHTGRSFPEGNFVDVSGNVIGTHKGIIRYTPGQRRGLGVSADRRLYVISKHGENNSVKLGDESALFSRRIKIRGMNLVAIDRLTARINVETKIRYGKLGAPSAVYPLSETEALIEFDKPQRAPVCGQSAVFYDGDYVVGGGVISEVLSENA